MTTTPPPVIRITEQEALTDEWRRDFVRAAEQEALNNEAGWRTINGEPDNDGCPFLITDDPTDADCVSVVDRVAAVHDFASPDTALDWTTREPTHWMPVPVAKKAGATKQERDAEQIRDWVQRDQEFLKARHKYFMSEFALILAAKGHAVDYQTLERLADVAIGDV